MTKSEGIVIELGVADVPASAAFYGGRFGMSVIETVDGDDGTTIWAELDFHGTRMMLQERKALADELPALAGREAGCVAVVLRVTPRESVTTMWRNAVSAGTDCEPPVDTDYGTREFWLSDPDGFVVLVAGRDVETSG